MRRHDPDYPYAMVLAGSRAERDLVKAGWTLTDEWPDGWRHYEPPAE